MSSRSEHFYYIDVPFQGHVSSSNAIEVVNGICNVVRQDNSSYLLVLVNQALLETDHGQSEALSHERCFTSTRKTTWLHKTKDK